MTKVGVDFWKVDAHYLVKDIIEGKFNTIEINHNPKNFYIPKEEFKEIGVEVEALGYTQLTLKSTANKRKYFADSKNNNRFIAINIKTHIFMIRQGILLVVALFSVGLLNAQSIGFGAKVGLNLNRLPGGASTAVATGFHGGLFGTVKFLGVGARAELLISGKGAETTINYNNLTVQSGVTTAGSIVTKANLWYVDIPILFEYKLPVIPIYFNVGPQFSLLLNNKLASVDVNSLTQLSSASLETLKSNIEKDFNFKNSDVALVLGVGVTVLKIDAGIRYTLGLTQVSNFQSTASSIRSLSDVNLKNHSFQVYLGFKFL